MVLEFFKKIIKKEQMNLFFYNYFYDTWISMFII